MNPNGDFVDAQNDSGHSYQGYYCLTIMNDATPRFSKLFSNDVKRVLTVTSLLRRSFNGCGHVC